jgi:hypothetical protein
MRRVVGAVHFEVGSLFWWELFIGQSLGLVVFEQVRCKLGGWGTTAYRPLRCEQQAVCLLSAQSLHSELACFTRHTLQGNLTLNRMLYLLRLHTLLLCVCALLRTLSH